jgi:alpha-1,6-mannosyltransferase
VASVATPADRAPRAFPAARPRRPELAAVAEASLGVLAVAGVLTGCVGFALAQAERPSFLAPPTIHGDPSWLAGPLAGLWPSLTRSAPSLEWGASMALLAMTACWLLAVACAPRLGLRVILPAAIAAIAVLTLAPPFSLTDTFNYLHYARMGPLYGLNPYTHLPIEASADPIYRWTTWHHLRSPYGPLFTFAFQLLAPLGVAQEYWTLKVAVAVAAVCVAVLVALLAKRFGRDPATAVAFVMLNPLVLIYGIGGVHNDVFVLALLLGGMLLVQTRAAALGGVSWAAAVAIKLSAGLAVPFLLVGATRRLRVAGGLALGAAGAAALVFFAFGGHLPNDGQQDRLVVALGPANLLGLALGHGGLDAGLRHTLTVALGAGTLALALWTWRTRNWAAGAAWSAVLLLLTLGWVVPWYVLWVLPFAALAPRPAPRAVAVALTVYLLLIWAPASAPALHQFGEYPSATATGRANNHFLQTLLR